MKAITNHFWWCCATCNGYAMGEMNTLEYTLQLMKKKATFKELSHPALRKTVTAKLLILTTQGHKKFIIPFTINTLQNLASPILEKLLELI